MERPQSKKAKKPKPGPKKTTIDREKAFAFHYLKLLNATQAAIATGLPARSAQVEGSKLLSRPMVQSIITKARDGLAQRTNVTVEKLLAELGKIAFANMDDYFQAGPDGEPVLRHWDELTEDQKAAVEEYVTETYWDEGAQSSVKRVKFKLHNKISAIEKAGKHLGMFDRHRGGNADDEGDGGTTINNHYTLKIGNALIPIQGSPATPADNLSAPNTISVTATRDL